MTPKKNKPPIEGQLYAKVNDFTPSRVKAQQEQEREDLKQPVSGNAVAFDADSAATPDPETESGFSAQDVEDFLAWKRGQIAEKAAMFQKITDTTTAWNAGMVVGSDFARLMEEAARPGRSIPFAESYPPVRLAAADLAEPKWDLKAYWDK